MEKDRTKHPEKSRLTRWSRRKAQATERAAADHAPQSARPPAAHQNPEAGDNAARGAPGPPEILTDADMPPIDSLTEDSDFSGFLSPGVSEGLRKAALRKLFNSPGFNIRDGLDDYDDDFRNFAALGDLITSDMKHQMELAEERKRKAREQEATEAGAQPQPAKTEAPDGGETPPVQETDETTTGGAQTQSAKTEQAATEAPNRAETPSVQKPGKAATGGPQTQPAKTEAPDGGETPPVQETDETTASGAQTQPAKTEQAATEAPNRAETPSVQKPGKSATGGPQMEPAKTGQATPESPDGVETPTVQETGKDTARPDGEQRPDKGPTHHRQADTKPL